MSEAVLNNGSQMATKSKDDVFTEVTVSKLGSNNASTALAIRIS